MFFKIITTIGGMLHITIAIIYDPNQIRITNKGSTSMKERAVMINYVCCP